VNELLPVGGHNLNRPLNIGHLIRRRGHYIDAERKISILDGTGSEQEIIIIQEHALNLSVKKICNATFFS